MRKIKLWMPLSALLLVMAGLAANAKETLHLQKINDHIYAIVGPLGMRTPGNLGNNATFGFVVTDEGVVLIDAGGTYQGATAIDALIGRVTSKPVKLVISCCRTTKSVGPTH